MKPEEFLAAVQSRIEWMRTHNPELLERDVMFMDFMNSSAAARINDVFVEDFLVLHGEVVY